jgi:uncharacterized membrane protein YgcG
MSDFQQRLSHLRVELEDTVAEAQRMEIRRALARHRRSSAFPRRRLAAVLVATLLVLQAGVAWAAEATLPGDVLYDVKLAYEEPRSWFDGDVRLRNRLAEAGQLVDSQPSLAEALLDEAEDEVDADSNAELIGQLEGLRIQLRTRARDGSGSGGGGGGNGPGGGHGP